MLKVNKDEVEIIGSRVMVLSELRNVSPKNERKWFHQGRHTKKY